VPVGIYNVVKQIAGALNKVASASSAAVFPEIAVLASQKRLDDARGVVRKIAWFSVALGGCAVLASVLFGGYVLELGFGVDFRLGWRALVLLAVAATLSFASTPYSMFVQAVISPSRLMRAHVISFLTYLACAPVVIKVWSLNGAAVAQVVFSLVLLATCWNMHRAVAGQRV
jgi:O-antigen/teichoic acid export membrane protein